MLPDDLQTRRLALEAIRRVLTAFGSLGGEDQERLARVTKLFDLNAAVASKTSSLYRRQSSTYKPEHRSCANRPCT
jgi:hypothetical protein